MGKQNNEQIVVVYVNQRKISKTIEQLKALSSIPGNETLHVFFVSAKEPNRKGKLSVNRRALDQFQFLMKHVAKPNFRSKGSRDEAVMLAKEGYWQIAVEFLPEAHSLYGQTLGAMDVIVSRKYRGVIYTLSCAEDIPAVKLSWKAVSAATELVADHHCIDRIELRLTVKPEPIEMLCAGVGLGFARVMAFVKFLRSIELLQGIRQRLATGFHIFENTAH